MFFMSVLDTLILTAASPIEIEHKIIVIQNFMHSEFSPARQLNKINTDHLGKET